MRQYDLFGKIEAAEKRKTEWIALFPRDWWIAPWDTSSMKAGEKVLGWVCPNCRRVEPNDYLLGINHGYCLHWPSEIHDQCISQILRANHRRADHPWINSDAGDPE